MNNKYDAIIIGSGIAGITCAIYLKRANKNILLLEGNIPGGQINNTSNVENYPGFTKIDGPSLVENLMKQIKENNIELKYEKVLDIKDNYKVITNKNEYLTDYIVLATGRIPNKLGIEEKYIGKGVSYCALCDGQLYKNKDVIVVGGGNSAFEESLYLSNICNSVSIIVRSNIKASDILKKEVNLRKNIKVYLNEEITNINEENDKIVSVNLKNNELKCDGIFIYIGLTPNIDYLKNLNINLENNYILVNEKLETNLKNIYACGDVIKKSTYQIVTAAGEGAIVASNIIKVME